MKRTLGVSNTLTDKTHHFQSWASLVSWMAEEFEKGTDRDVLLPFCNGWNLDYWENGESAEEYTGRLIEMAIGLQLI